jgi:RNA polymerase sigma factor (sigma-70 family)
VIDPQEKLRLFEETLDKNHQCIGFIARNNAPFDSWQDLDQEIRMAFWESLDSYDGVRSGLKTWLLSVADNTAKEFRRKDHNTRKREEVVYPNPVFVELDRDPLKTVEEFMGMLSELNRQVFTMLLNDISYAEMSSALGINEVNLRKRVSRIKEHFKEHCKDF